MDLIFNEISHNIYIDISKPSEQKVLLDFFSALILWDAPALYVDHS